MIYTTEDFPIKLEYWYVVALGNYLDIKVFPVYFINKVSARRAITTTFASRQRSRYTIISGRKLKSYKIKYGIGLGKLSRFTKYEFPLNATSQEKKNIRTVTRRRLRRMGMLIPKKHKLTIGDDVKQARVLVNTQKVAMRSLDGPRAFRLERLPKKYYHIILDKVKSKKNKVMFEVNCIRYNKKTGAYKKLLLHIYNKDVIIPHLISEVFAQAFNNNNYGELKQYCSSEGISLYKTPKKKILPGDI